MLSRKYYVYICEYSFVETVFPRHFTSGFSKCTKIAELAEDVTKTALPASLYQELATKGEVLVVDRELVLRILLELKLEMRESGENNYLVIKQV